MRHATATLALGALALGALPAAGQTIGGQEIAKYCTAVPGAAAPVLDIDALVCAATGTGELCDGDPGFTADLRRKYFTVTSGERQYASLAWANVAAGAHSVLTARPIGQCAAPGTALTRASFAEAGCVEVLCTGLTGSGAGVALPALLGKIRVRQDPGELAKRADVANAATASLLRNFDGGGNTFALQAAVGIPVELNIGAEGDLPLTLLPYLAVDRVESRSIDDITNLSLGTRLSYSYEPPPDSGGWGHFVDAGTSLVTDEEVDSLILTGSLTYRPIPGHRIFTEGLEVGPLRVVPVALGLVEFGTVFDSGTKIELLDTNQYLRAGAELSLFVGPNAGLVDAWPFLENFDLSLRYRYLRGFDGPFDNIDQFEATLGYRFPNQENFGFEFSYFKGNKDITLEEQEYFLSAFSVKF